MDKYCIFIKYGKGKCILSHWKTDNRVFGTMRKRDSNGLFTATIKNVENSCQANVIGNAVPNENVRRHDTE